jgi:predicted phosphodiesterase
MRKVGEVKRVLILPDCHLNQDNPSAEYKLAKSFLKDYLPDETILLGDFADCTSLSHWIDGKAKLLENRRFFKECQVLNDELDDIQHYSGKVTYIEGNHENWAVQYVIRNPQVEGVIDIPIQLKLEDRGISWYALDSKLPKKRLYRLGKCHFIHGCYINKYHAFKHLITYGCCLVYGHTHQSQSYMLNMMEQEPIMAWGLGCLCSHAPDYLRGRPANWISQFATFEYNTKTGNFNLYPVNITDKRFIYQGKEYKWK